MNWTAEETREIHERLFAKDLQGAWHHLCEVLPHARAVSLPTSTFARLKPELHAFAKSLDPVEQLFERFIKHFDRTEERFAEGLEHDEPMVVAYSMTGLARLDCASIATLVQNVRPRREMLTYSIGNWSGEATLGEIADAMVPSHGGANERV